MFGSFAIPAIASAEFSLVPSRWQWRWLVLVHLLVPVLLLLNRPPWLFLVLICLALMAHGYWQWRVLARRSGTLLVGSRGLHFDSGDGDPVPVVCGVSYLSRWLLVLEFELESGRQRQALWRDGYLSEDWRRLQVLAREWLSEKP